MKRRDVLILGLLAPSAAASMAATALAQDRYPSRAVRLAVASALADDALRARVRAIPSSPFATSGAARAADLLERFSVRNTN